jgi:hypothetical protein
MSRNYKVIQVLLDKGADIHLKCVFDPRVSSKKIYPIQYFLKRLRLNGPDEKGHDLKILKILIRNKIKVENTEEKIAVQR